MRGETRVSPVLISSHKISKKPYVQSLQKKLGVNQYIGTHHIDMSFQYLSYLYSAVMDADLRDLWYACSKHILCEVII